MNGKIALEEHFAIPQTVQDSAGFLPGVYWDELQARLLDIHDKRLRLMDEHGIDMQIGSWTSPIQLVPGDRAIARCPR